MESGKAYANRLPQKERPVGDFYPTAKSLTWELLKTGEVDTNSHIIDPCAGDGAVVEAIKEKHPEMQIDASDWYTDYGDRANIYDLRGHWDAVVTNFPFSEWDKMVKKSLSIADKVITIGRLNYFGSVGRYETGLWDKLKKVYVFNRMVDYRGPVHPEGLFHVGALVTGWFVFDNHHDKLQGTTMEVLDVQKYAKLGAYKPELYQEVV